MGAGCTNCDVPATTASVGAPLPFGLRPAGVVPSLDAALQSICAEVWMSLCV